MAGLVIDASVAGGWLIADEASAYADAALAQVARAGATVPALWSYEVANLLLAAQRRERATSDDVAEAMRLLGSLPLDVEPPHAPSTLVALVRTARAHDLTAYDAAYLELAMRTRSVLATRDTALVRAAAKAGVRLFEA